MIIMSEPNHAVLSEGTVVELSAEMQKREGLDVTYARVERTEGGCRNCVLLPVENCKEYLVCYHPYRPDRLNMNLVQLEKPE
jgi:hypothetical protein